MNREPFNGWPYEHDDTRSGALIGHLICGVSGLILGWLLASVSGVATATCEALLRVLP